MPEFRPLLKENCEIHDGSESIENSHLDEDGDFVTPYIDSDMEVVSELSYEQLCEMEQLNMEEKGTNITPYQQSTLDNPEQSEYSNNNVGAHVKT